MTTDVRTLLASHGYSLTAPRQTVFDELKKLHKPVTVVELAKRLPEVDRVSVYRTVDVFEKIGVARRVWTGFKSKIELSEEFSSHHHHFACLKCGKTIDLESEELERSMKAFETRHGFTLVQHSVELTGYCADCRS